MASIASFSGLASGIQWQDMIDQIMAAERARRVSPLTSQITQQQQRSAAWTSYQMVLGKLDAASKALRDGAAFGTHTATATAGAGGRALVSATASAAASPGTYKVEVVGLAKAAKLSGDVVPSASAALGLDGDFAVNGRKVTVVPTDTLGSIRDKLNAANGGSTPSRASASILSTGGDQHRLVLTSDVAGAAGIELVDGESGILRRLGLVGQEMVPNATASGGTASRAVSGVTTAIASALGVSMPAPSTIRVGDRVIPVDLETDSLASIAAKIQAQGIPARTVAAIIDGRTTHRLEVEATVTADPADAAASARTVELLGFAQPGRGAVHQVVAGDQPWTDGGAAAGGASLLTGLELGGREAELVAGDEITIRGVDGAGAAVSRTFAIGAATTVDDLLGEIDAAFAGGRGATATLGADGTLQLRDAQGGESRLALSLSVKRGDTEAALLGRTGVATAGRLREVAQGSDAVLRVDGVTVTRGGNSVSDVIAGVTLSLQGAEPGTEIDVKVARDDAATVNAVKAFAAAYNEAAAFMKAQSAPGAPLAFNGTLRGTMSQLTSVLLTDMAGLADGAAFERATLVGVSLSRTGVLEVDEAKLKAALQTSFGDVKALFAAAGTTTDASLEYVTAGAGTVPGRYDVAITTAAERPRLAGSLAGSYTATVPGSDDRLKVTDAASGKTIELALADGATTADIVAGLNARFAADGLRLTAAQDGANLTITGAEYGSAARITVEYLPADGTSGDPFGLAGTAAGVDVAGTINGLLATGSGRTLTAAASTDGVPNPAAGLVVTHLGSGPIAATVGMSRGLGGMMAQVTGRMTRAGDGTVALQQDSISTSITSLERRRTDAEDRLVMRREAMERQFAAMEAAMARIQSQGNWLTQQVSALNASRQR